MAHELQSATDMAYIGETPWHGLGNRLPANQPIEVWQKQAGMDWQIKETDVLFNVSDEGNFHVKANPDAKVLYRSDNHAPLSVVSQRYKVVQPHDVLEFYRDLVSAGGFELETAGVLKAGENSVKIGDSGYSEWLKASEGLILSFHKPANGRVIAFSPDGTVIYDSVVDKGDVYIPQDGFLELSGATRDVFDLTAR